MAPAKSSGARFRTAGAIAHLLLALPPGAGGGEVERLLRGAQEGSKTWTQVLAILGRQRRWDLAVSVLAFLRGNGYEVNEYHCSAAISACERCGQWEAALALLRRSEVDGEQPNAFCYSAAIGACDKGGEWQRALALLAAMGRGVHGGPAPNHFCYSAGVRACASARQWQLALALLGEMRGRGVEPNLHTYTAAISACQRVGRWQAALGLLDEAWAAGLSPDVVAYSAAASACEAGHQWQRALGLLGEMRRRSVAPNAVTYNAALSACEQGGRWSIALDLLREMRAAGVAPDVVAYGAVVCACEAAGQAQAVADIARTVREEVLPGVATPRQAVHAIVCLAKLGHRDEAGGGDAAQPVDAPVWERLVALAVEGIAELGARDLSSLAWALAVLRLPCPAACARGIAGRAVAVEAELSWQAVGTLDFALRALSGGVPAEAAESLRRAARAAAAGVAARSARANRAPEELLLGGGSMEAVEGPILVVDDADAYAAMKALGRDVRRWGRMSSRGRRGSAEFPGGAARGAVVRLSGVQSNAGGASLRLAVAGAAGCLSAGAPLWLLGLEEEGIGEAAQALQGLFDAPAQVAGGGGGTARVLLARRRRGEAPPLESFAARVPLPLGSVGFEDVPEWRVWPGLFAGGGLDIMTSFLLRRLRRLQVAPGARVLDFCAGSGAIAKAALQLQPLAQVHLADADAFAIEAARHNVPEAAGWHLGDGWRPLPPGLTFDLVLSNPPVHRRRQDDFGVVEALIEGALERLAQPGGRLWIVTQVGVPAGPLLESRGLRTKSESDGRFVLWRAKLPRGDADRAAKRSRVRPTQ